MSCFVPLLARFFYIIRNKKFVLYFNAKVKKVFYMAKLFEKKLIIDEIYTLEI